MLLYFILGILFISIVLPIIENLLSCLSSWSEYITYIFALKVYKIKQEIAGNNDEQQQKQKTPMGFQQTQAIGYMIPNECVQEGEEE